MPGGSVRLCVMLPGFLGVRPSSCTRVKIPAGPHLHVTNFSLNVQCIHFSCLFGKNELRVYRAISVPWLSGFLFFYFLFKVTRQAIVGLGSPTDTLRIKKFGCVVTSRK